MTPMNRPVTETAPTPNCSRREALTRCAAGLVTAGTLALGREKLRADDAGKRALEPRPWVTVRGTYGGYLTAITSRNETPADYGINATWVGSGGLRKEEIDRHHDMGLKVFAEFNSMHLATFLNDHPDAAPIGPDGRPSPPPDDWVGVSPFHAGYRKNRMDEFRRVLETFDIDGIWLDYHHSQANWEQAEPNMPDTDFCPTALRQFTETTGIKLPASIPEAAQQLLGPHREAWTRFRCDVFTDWVREYREILNATRPKALLGTFHCPWSPEDFDGAIRHKLAIDLVAQKPYLDVFSIMPYHARFGHAQDHEWIARQTTSLGRLLDLKGAADEKQKIWPIVQLADWGEKVTADQVPQIIDYGTRLPATGVMVFHWGGVSREWDKADALGSAYRSIRPASAT